MQQTTESSRARALISTRQLARFLGVSVTTVYAWQTRGGGPPGYRVGRHTRYRPEEVLAWLEQRRTAKGAT
jgi:excisionase family DNA binding protein